MAEHTTQDPARIFGSFRLPTFASGNRGSPILVAIEGPNGAGKTTLCAKLSQELQVPHFLGTDEAWFAESLKVRMIRDADWFASAMFFLSGCFEQSRLLRERTETLIILDRSLWSTLAVHAAEKPERLKTLIDMLAPISPHVQIPQVTVVLDASFATCQQRISLKSGTARALDQLTATPEFHARERQFYGWLARESKTVLFLETNGRGIDEVARDAVEVIRSNIRAI